MQFGVSMWPTDSSMPLAELGPVIEEGRLESFFVPEHSHIPVNDVSPHPYERTTPEIYRRFLDPFISLSVVATVTSELRLGTAICLVVQHDPIQLAKTVASLDHISAGRVLLGLASGWNEQEMANHGVRFRDRWDVMRESVAAMREIWTSEQAEYHGTFVNFDPIWSWPKPAQQVGPQILIGGEGPRALRHAAQYGDGWIARYIRFREQPTAMMARLHELASEAGRPAPEVSLLGAPKDPKEIAHLEASGVSRCIFALPSAGRDEVLPELSKVREIAASFR